MFVELAVHTTSRQMWKASELFLRIVHHRLKCSKSIFFDRGPVMEIRELRSLVMLKELGSLTKSAERLNLSAAAIHKQLKVLEAELGVQLYEKAGRRLRLTSAA